MNNVTPIKPDCRRAYLVAHVDTSVVPPVVLGVGIYSETAQSLLHNGEPVKIKGVLVEHASIAAAVKRARRLSVELGTSFVCFTVRAVRL